MENNKKSKALTIILVLIIIGLSGYLVYDKFITTDETTTTKETKEETKKTTANETKFKSENKIEDLYKSYLDNLKKDITTKYNDNNYNVINGKYYNDTLYTFSITKDLDLVFTSYDSKFNQYKVSDNVLNMFIVETGNGGFKTLYFIKSDGSLNSLAIDSIADTGKIDVKKENKEYIVNVTTGGFDLNESGAYGPIFIDVKGNVFTE